MEMHLITERLPVFWKQREMRFFPVSERRCVSRGLLLLVLFWGGGGGARAQAAAPALFLLCQEGLTRAHPRCQRPAALSAEPSSPPLPSPLPFRLVQGWCFALPSFLFRLPYALLDATLWSLITYWAVGFDDSWRFLIFWLFMFITCAW